jgi:YspA, cpYpsA-related SLOG family
MRVLVCGSRNWPDPAAIRKRLRDLPMRSVVIHGGARGADEIAGTVANGLGFEVRVFKADWDAWGAEAGKRRNLRMLAESPDLVIAFWASGSTGTAHTISNARRLGIPVEVHIR